MNLVHWIMSDWAHAVVSIDFFLMGLVALWGLWTNSYERQMGHKMPMNNFVLFMGFVQDLSRNFPGLVNRALIAGGKTPLFLTRKTEEND